MLQSKYFFVGILSVQILFFILLFSLDIQTLIFSKYPSSILTILIYLNFITSFILLSINLHRLFKWLEKNKNKIIFLYFCAFLIFVSHIIIGLVYLQNEIHKKPIMIEYLPPRLLFASIYNVHPELTALLAISYDLTSIVSFILIWITTILLLYKYSKKLGKIKFWTLMILPLIYFLLRYEIIIYYLIGYTFNFYDFLKATTLDSFVSYNMINLIFSASQQIGAILFGSVFWIIANKIHELNLKRYLTLISIGIIFLYGSNEIYTLALVANPPFGILTISYMVLGTYLVLLGLFNTASYISKNNKIRKEIYLHVEEEFKLLKNLGISQMESEMEKRYKKILSKVSDQEDISRDDFEEENLKEIIQQAVDEIAKKK